MNTAFTLMSIRRLPTRVGVKTVNANYAAVFFTPRRQTELFNGYGEQVASMYSDMDLRHFF